MNKKGYSIIEILVVVGVFAVIGVIATQAISLSLKSSKKSDSMVDVKQELDNATGNIERLLQTADMVIVGVDCSTVNATSSVGFRNASGRSDVACLDMTAGFYTLNNDRRIAMSSGETINYRQRLTSNATDITSCNISCYTQNYQTYIDLSVTGLIKGRSVLEGASYTSSKKVLVRGSFRK